MTSRLQWSKFWWGDWARDAALRASSYAAKGLWMDMLCQMDAGEEKGFLLVSGRAATPIEIAKLVGGARRTVERLLVELEERKVFSRDERGAIFSRRMVRDCGRSEQNRSNGERGGNPILLKNKGLPIKPVKAEAEAEAEAEADSKRRGAADAASTKRAHRLPDEWKPSAASIGKCLALGLDLDRTTTMFRNHFQSAGGEKGRKLNWDQTFENWCLNDRLARPAVHVNGTRTTQRSTTEQNRFDLLTDIGAFDAPFVEGNSA